MDQAAAVEPRVLFIWWADGGTPPSTKRTVCAQGSPTPFRCQWGSLEQCKKDVQALLSEASGAEFDGVSWLHDRLEVVESEAQSVPPVADQSILAIPPPGTASDEIRRHVERLHAIAKELGGSEGE